MCTAASCCIDISLTLTGRATHIDEGEFTAMWTDLVELMKVGVRRGKIIAIRPEDDHGLPSYGPNRPRTYVYRRAGEPCRVCGTPRSAPQC